MSQEPQTLSFTQLVKVSPAQAYYAFTNATALREWLCNSSQAVPIPGGRLYLWWDSGYYTAGEYSAIVPDRSVAFTWRGRGEPEGTLVLVSFEDQDGGTAVRVDHSGIGDGPEWQPAREQIRKGWETGLENLASVLEIGEDQRFVRRPMLGILLSDFNANIAKLLGIPVEKGVRLDGTVEGMGAQAAGLQRDDVIVSMAGVPVTDFNSLTQALGNHHAGDRIEVIFYRGPEKKTIQMQLSGRPIPEIPQTAASLAERLQEIHASLDAGLDQLFEGVSEEQAGRSPKPGEWSAKEVLAHLILDERATGDYIADLAGGYERVADDYGGNSHERTRAVVSVYPTVRDLLDELKRTQSENVAFIAKLPKQFQDRKGSYWRLAYGLISPPLHTQLHFEQIRSALETG